MVAPTWIPRDTEERLRRFSNQRPVIIVTGARQTGKTSLVRTLFPDHGFVSLDLPSEADQADREPAAFLERHPPPLTIDEVQYAPGIFRHLKTLVDAKRSENGRFVLTGSQKLALMREASESLAGRVGIVELEGLSLHELGRARRGVSVEQAILRGAMPELWEKPDLDAAEFQSAYVATYLERDLRSLLAVSSLRDFERFLRACALRSAQLLNKAELARDVGISPSTAGQWLSVLEASNQIVLLEPWFSNRTKSLVKAPKLYLSDTGLLAYLVGIRTEADLLASPFVGALWETLVFGELRRLSKVGLLSGDLFFYRDRTKEVDFLVHRGGRFELYEAKWTERPDPRMIANLRRVEDDLPRRSVVRRAVVCRTPHEVPFAEGIHAVPISSLAGSA